MKLKKGPIPLYYQLERDLRKRIQSGEFENKKPFPTERGLCDEYEVSRTTVRQAVMILESEGLLKREQGRGTFIAGRDKEDISYRLYGYTDDVFLVGSRTKLDLIERKQVRLDPRTAADMELDEGDEVIRFKGIRYFGPDSRKALFYAWVQKEIGEKIPWRELKDPYLIAAVEQVSLQSVKRAHQVISAAVATALHEKTIDVKKGEPILVIRHIYFSTTGMVLEVAETHFPSDMYQPKAILERITSRYPTRNNLELGGE